MAIIDGKVVDLAQLRPKNRAATNRIYVNSGTGDDSNRGDIGSPLATLVEAVARVPEGYVGLTEIQTIGAGPYTMPLSHPRPGVGGVLIIYGDRTTPVVSKAVPAFSLKAGKLNQIEDVAFGAHGGFADGTHWIDVDISSFGSTAQSFGTVCQASVSPSIEVPAGFGSAVQSDVYALTTVIDVPIAYKGGAPTDSDLFHGANYFGFLFTAADPSFATVVIRGIAFDACVFVDGRWQFERCSIGGYYNDSDGNGAFSAVGCDVLGFQLGSSIANPIIIDGARGVGLSRCKIEGDIEVRPGTHFRFVRAIDFDAGNGLDCGPDSVVEFVGGVSANGVRLIRTKGRILGNSFGDHIGTVTGNVVELEDGGRMDNIVSARWTITAGGSEIVVGANAGTTMALATGTNDLAAGTPQGCFAL